MNRAHLTTAAALAFVLLMPAHSSAMELDSFVGEINVTAHTDLGRFRADLSASFGVSSGEVDELFDICDSPADVYMTLRIGQIAEVSINRVVTEYRANRGRGWGAIAKSLGIKPGSPEFHALKDGRLIAQSQSGASGKAAKGSGSKKAKSPK
jgi:hypothetical protein